MCSLDESDEAYQYLGLPGYTPHLSRETFLRYYDQKKEQEQKQQEQTDKEKMLFINAHRIFNIAASGKTWQEREDLARTYFDMVSAVEIGMEPENYYIDTDQISDYQGKKKQADGRRLLMQIYLVNDVRGIYAFRPIVLHGYLYHRLLKAGYLVGEYKDLKKRIDWTYMPHNLRNGELGYICSPSYFRRERRKHLRHQTESLKREYLREPNWYYWPDLD